MDNTWWKKIAATWVHIKSQESITMLKQNVSTLVDDAFQHRHTETSLLDDILSDLDDDDDF